MIIARWSFSSQFTKTDECVGILREWAGDVGERTGWKIGALRVLRGVLGASDTEIEVESRLESLSELDAALADMQRATRQKEYMHKLHGVMVPGTSRWSVYREEKLTRE